MDTTVMALLADALVCVLPLAVGALLDALLGDPLWLPHPVVGFGKWISFWERRLNRGKHRMAKGAVLALASVALVFLSACIVCVLPFRLGLDRLWSDFVYIAVCSVLVFYCLAFRTLCREVRTVFTASERGVGEARRQLSRIVGRDTSELSVQECRTAALETLAENLSDGVIAPLFWYVVAGAPGMLAYKMVNTLDSMIGYRTPRYRSFGCWAARIDDIANFIPARITALILVLVCSDRHKVRLLRFVLRYAGCHLSPNSGWPEAAMAGIADCRFGGTHTYFGEAVYKPFIGENPRQLSSGDVVPCMAVCTRAVAVSLAVSLVLHMALVYAIFF